MRHIVLKVIVAIVSAIAGSFIIIIDGADAGSWKWCSRPGGITDCRDIGCPRVIASGFASREACEAARTGKKAAKKREPPKTEAVDAAALKKKQQAEAARKAKAAEAEAAALKKKQQAEAAQKAKAAAAAAEAEHARRSAATELDTARNAALQAMIDANQILASLGASEQRNILRESIDSLAQAMEAGSLDAIKTQTALLLRLKDEAERVQPAEPAAAQPSPAVTTPPQRRVALVIGNSAYRNAVELPNPRNDAHAISAALKDLGFEVITGEDLDKPSMETKVREFVTKVNGSAVSLFFYAGHGMQVGGRNYLIPIDAKLEDAAAIDFETIDADRILGYMTDENRIAIALLDACRDNPLARKFARSLGATRSAAVGQGLAVPSIPGGGLLIGFATAPGEVALDGQGKNSPFTTALLKHLPTKGIEIQQVMTRIKSDVYQVTGKQQRPWHNSDLRAEFYLNPQ
jgi:hypothetical protein